MRACFSNSRAATLTAALACASWPSVAQEDPTSGDAWGFQWENDLFAKGRSDRYYTNGLRVVRSRSWQPLDGSRAVGFHASVAQWTGALMCRWSACDGARSLVAIDTHGGQNMYTPQDLRRPQAYPYDRPYAGWLYIGERTRLADDPDPNGEAQRLQALDVVVGVIGPSAGAGKVQEEWHHFINAIDPQGWSSQLRDEPTIQVTYTRTRRDVLGSKVDALPYWRLTLGNVFAGAAVGGQLRWGPDLDGFGHFDPAASAIPMAAAAARPSNAAAAKGGDRGSPMYAFLSFEGRAVARNAFIDGNAFRDYPNPSYISRRPFNADVTVGFSVKLSGRTRLTYGHTWRSREFDLEQQPVRGSVKPSAVQRYGVVQLQVED